MDRVILRKPKLFFETDPNPSHLTLDDGKQLHRIIPWLHFVEARWEYAELDVIKMEIGDWLVHFRGHNLEPLVRAIGNRTLVFVRAQPELMRDRERDIDTFVTELQFLHPPERTSVKRGGQMEIDLRG